MALKGAGSDPLQGIKGAKPRLREPKVPRRKETPETARLGEIYLKRRNLLMKLKINREALALGIAREQLIEKELVIKQLSWFLAAIRSRLLAFPGNLAARFGTKFSREMREEADQTVRKLLEELQRLPECVEPDWLERLEEEG